MWRWRQRPEGGVVAALAAAAMSEVAVTAVTVVTATAAASRRKVLGSLVVPGKVVAVWSRRKRQVIPLGRRSTRPL